jgi:alpha-beta hydrolase superfamily lysophospholipase
MEKLVTTLQAVGYRDGENMFGANYDFRYAAAPPGQPSHVFNSDLSRIRDLVEHASRKNGGKPVIFVSHAFGGYFALEFLGGYLAATLRYKGAARADDDRRRRRFALARAAHLLGW